MYRFVLLVVVLLAGASLTACSDDSSSKPVEFVEPVEEGTFFIRDDDGRVLILHGMNVMGSAKGDPGHVPVDITREYVQHYGREWGFNFARYLIQWDGVEPSPGMYDEAYLDATEERLDWLWEEGIFVMLDMHQDVYSKYFGHNGAPVWAVEDDGLPFENQPSWDQDYWQPGVMRAFENFWNYEGPYPYLQDYYAEAWTVVVERFKDHPAVIGYDLMNEPSPGEAIRLEEVFVTPGDGPAAEFDRTLFTAFYQRLIDRIREVDPDGWIIYEPRFAGPANGQPSYIGKLSDPRPDKARIAYSPHLYSVIMELTGYKPANDNTIADWEMNRSVEVEAQRAPIILGEWGFDWTWENAPLFMDEVHQMADRMMLSWAYWPGDPNRRDSPSGWSIWDWEDSSGKVGIAERSAANVLVRVYPQRVAGIPRSFSYEPATRVFELSFDPSPSATKPTEIFIPERRHYTGGWALSGCDEAEGCTSTWDADREILRIFTTRQTERVELTISPAP